MTTTSTPSAVDRYVVLAICGLPFLMVMLDGTVVNVALPSIAKELHSTLQSLQWIVSAYVLVIASIAILMGMLADRFGRRRILVLGVIIFTAGSIACAIVPNEELLIASRAFQAIGGAMISPASLAVVTTVFVTQAERAKAFAIWSIIASVGLAIGPLLGGVIVQSLGWRAVFFVNVIPGVLAVILLLWKTPASKADVVKPFDPVGQVFLITFLASLVTVVIQVTTLGWASPVIIGASAVAVVSLVVLVLFERRKEEALIPFELFRSRAFTSALITLLVGVLGSGAVMFTASLFLQNFRGLSPLEAGLFMLPLAAASAIAAVVSGALVGRGRARGVLIVAGSLIAVAGVAFTLTSELSVWFMLVPFTIMGLAFGALNDPVTVSAVSELPAAKAGLAASLISMGRQVGQVLGVALAGALLSTGLGADMKTGFDSAAQSVWVMLIVAGLVIAAVNVLVNRPRTAADRARTIDSHAGRSMAEAAS